MDSDPPAEPSQKSPLDAPARSTAAIRVFLAEDHAITLWGLQRLIESRPAQFSVVGTADSCSALLAHPALLQTQVLVMDLDLGHEDGLDALPEVMRRSPAQVLVLTASADTQRHCRAIELGARGVMHKAEAPQQILTAITQVQGGAAWLNPQLMGQVLGRLTQPSENARRAPAPDTPQSRLANLTARELDIVRALCHFPGDKLLTVADQLGLRENTLRNHLTAVYGKLGVRGRLELHLFASEHGLTGQANSQPGEGRKPGSPK
jgi:DNA-binding NarL/FixJ family response regulator